MLEKYQVLTMSTESYNYVNNIFFYVNRLEHVSYGNNPLLTRSITACKLINLSIIIIY